MCSSGPAVPNDRYADHNGTALQADAIAARCGSLLGAATARVLKHLDRDVVALDKVLGAGFRHH